MGQPHCTMARACPDTRVAVNLAAHILGSKSKTFLHSGLNYPPKVGRFNFHEQVGSPTCGNIPAFVSNLFKVILDHRIMPRRADRWICPCNPKSVTNRNRPLFNHQAPYPIPRRTVCAKHIGAGRQRNTNVAFLAAFHLFCPRLNASAGKVI